MRRIVPVVAWLIVAACSPQQMADQPRYESLEPSDRLAHDQAAQHPPPHTVPFGFEPVPPRPATDLALLSRGRQRYDIFCSPCHGLLGDAHGRVVDRGFPAPPTFHQSRLRQAPDRHIFEVITDGYGVMYPYGPRIPPRDRWAIVAYVRALQLSQHADIGALGIPPQRIEEARHETP